MDRARSALLALAATLLLPPAATAAATLRLSVPADRACPQPAVIDLGAPPGGSSDVSEMNDHGWIVGTTIDAAGVRRATIWRGSSLQLLDVPRADGEFSTAADVNDRGWVVGGSGTSGWPGAQRAWIWRGEKAQLLPGLPGGGGTTAR